MGDASLTTNLGRVLVTGGAGFVGANLVTTLLERGYHVRSFDRAPSALPKHANLEVLTGDICDTDTVATAVADIDTIIHTAAIIDLMGGASVTDGVPQAQFRRQRRRHQEPGARRAAGRRQALRLHRLQFAW